MLTLRTVLYNIDVLVVNKMLGIVRVVYFEAEIVFGDFAVKS